MMATLRSFIALLLARTMVGSAISTENRDPLFRIALKTWSSSAPFPKFANPCGSTYANFGNKGALATLIFLVPLIDLKFLIRACGTRCRNFKSAALVGAHRAQKGSPAKGPGTPYSLQRNIVRNR